MGKREERVGPSKRERGEETGWWGQLGVGHLSDESLLLQTPLRTAARQRHLLQTRTNGSPAFGLYQWEVETGVYQLFGLVVLDVVDEQIAHIVVFLDLSSISFFALPPTLPSP
jgi:hypothetical protein